MKRRLLYAAIAVTLPCCHVSCENFTKADALRTLQAAGIGALQGAIPAARDELLEIQAEKVTPSAKTSREVLP